MTGRTKLPNPRRKGEPITLDWIRSNCRVEVTAVPMTECWTWLGSKNPDGYASAVMYAGRRRSPHRLAVLLDRADDDPALQADHICRNRACCNPLHIELVSQATNYDRGDWPGLSRSVAPMCGVCGGTRVVSNGNSNRPGYKFPFKCAECNIRINREWRARKRLEASLA